ncbi:uncharacterized protein LOC131937530 [Physella acuta]|uniref:uncharacterized protein LOC131937530 n=1 Tax=Physella acuta TaxID=109671 RepID=UPI0027DD5859|nr:uncharacterized protein LOC131937530 [Physella acuta]
MKRRCVLMVLTIILVNNASNNITAADRTRLLARLNDKSWPWFGDCYKKSCPDSTKDLTRCFNYRPKPETILQRAGIPSTVKLKFDLDVMFSSPEEKVDICGTLEVVQEVKPFRLNEDGFANKNMLQRGSEVYRNPPKINFDPDKGTTYQIIIFDVGLLMVRGYWCGVKIVNGIIQSEMRSKYLPPANPLPVVNPILIIVLKDTECFDIHICEYRGSSNADAHDCRDILVRRFGDGSDIVGLQVFYTDGTSLFEKYRACTEGYICDSVCIDKFKQYAVKKQPSITFADLDLSHLDMYVNLFSDSPFARMISYLCCSSRRYSRTIGVRARPGDDLKLSSYEKLCGHECFNHRKIEISSTVNNVLGDNLYYSFFAIVTSEENPVQVVWNVLNIKVPVSFKRDRLDENVEYYSDGNTTRHLYMLLFSHSTQVKFPLKVSDTGIVGIPDYFKLRAINWLRFDYKYYLPKEKKCNDPDRTCPPDEPLLKHDLSYELSFRGSSVPILDNTEPENNCVEGEKRVQEHSTNNAGQNSAHVGAVMWMLTCALVLILTLFCSDI